MDNGNPAIVDQDNDDEDSNTPAINYYFLLILVGAAIISIGFYSYHRRRKHLKEASRNLEQPFFQRDVNGWGGEGGPRGRMRWMPEGFQRMNFGHERRTEGLDERGEAPPPYQPSIENPSGTLPTNVPPIPVSVPMQTLSRTEAGLRPPGYEEAVQSTPTGSTAGHETASTNPTTDRSSILSSATPSTTDATSIPSPHLDPSYK